MSLRKGGLLVRVHSRRRRWLAVSLSACALSAFVAATTGSASGLAMPLDPAEGQAQGSNVNLVELRQQAQAARNELSQATQEYKQGRDKLEQARERLEDTRGELRETEKRLGRLQQPVGAIANAAYQHSPVKGFKSVFVSDDPKETMRAAVDFAKLTRKQQAQVREMSRLVQRKQGLLQGARNLAQRAQHRADKLAEKKQELQQKSNARTQQLVQAMQNIGLEVSRGDRLTIGCHPEKADVSGYPNGLIPESALCPLPQEDEHLRADAAAAFGRLNAAYAQHFGEALCVTDSYRSLADQQSLYYRKPSLAAVPGTSNHGMGLAIDLCGGVNSFGSPQFVWMKEHGPDFGWVHPDWASAWGARPEPWHWEYRPERS